MIPLRSEDVPEKTAPGRLGLTRVTFRSRLALVLGVWLANLRILSRYRGALVLVLLLPVIFAFLPVFIGAAVAGNTGAAATNFAANAGTADYKLYMLIGASTFTVVLVLISESATWIRSEMQTGTLESLYLAPTGRAPILLGNTLYSATFALFNFLGAYAIGALVLGVDPHLDGLPTAMVFLVLGMIPLWGLAFLMGALVLKLKQANAVMNLTQWLFLFLMGAFFPIVMLPPFLRAMALTFPPTWINNGVRSSLLDTGWLSTNLGVPVEFGMVADLGVLLLLGVVFPVFGWLVFRRVETQVVRSAGVGNF
ncbi:MAG TPA: ABC transporter permease [Thermoplasmata archaeon]|nr:ABC transporter permease [Thermoplasmata archaeon]